MRLNEQDSQLATAAVQFLEREYAERLERHPEGRGFRYGMRPDERDALDAHDRVTQVIRKLATGGDHELFDWETAIVRTSLTRYEHALSQLEATETRIADENSRYITTDEQRAAELARTQALLRKFPGGSG